MEGYKGEPPRKCGMGFKGKINIVLINKTNIMNIQSGLNNDSFFCYRKMAEKPDIVEKGASAGENAVIELDPNMDDLEADNEPVPLSRIEGGDLRVWFPKTGEVGFAEDIGYVREGGPA